MDGANDCWLDVGPGVSILAGLLGTGPHGIPVKVETLGKHHKKNREREISTNATDNPYRWKRQPWASV
jgi:hypothetical protein